MTSVVDMRQRLPAWKSALIGYQGVNAVGIGDMRNLGYVVVVEAEGVDLDLPPHLTGKGARYPVVVRQTPKSAFHLADGTVDGSDRVIASEIGRFGTLALVFSESSGNRLFGLTNAHVVTSPDRNSVGHEVSMKLNGTKIVIGHVAYHSAYLRGQVNSVDMALIELNAHGRDAAKTYEIQNIPGTVIGSAGLSFSRFAGAMRPHVYGGSTRNGRSVVPCSDPVEHPSATLLDESGEWMRFGRIFAMRSAGPVGVLPGHSGSLVVRETLTGGLVAAGLLAGGSGPRALVYSMSDIAREIRRAGINLG